MSFTKDELIKMLRTVEDARAVTEEAEAWYRWARDSLAEASQCTEVPAVPGNASPAQLREALQWLLPKTR